VLVLTSGVLWPFVLGSAAAAPLNEHQVLVFLVQLFILVGFARLLGGLMKRVGQPAVVGELLAGVILGQTVFGRIAPGAFEWVFGDNLVRSAVFAFAWIGVIFLMVVIGYETDLGIIVRVRRAAGWVSAGGFLVPLAIMGGAAWLVPDSFIGEGTDRVVFAGFFALALSVSALPVVAKILQDLSLMRRNFAQITLAAGMTMDAIGWLLLAALTGIALDGFQPELLARSFGGLVLFLAVVITAGRWFLDRAMRYILDRGSSVTAALTLVIIAALAGGIVTQALQLEAILGAFIVGILLATTRHQLPAVRHILETMTAAFFAPIFFAFSGLQIDIGLLRSTSAVGWAIGLILLAIVAKIAGTLLGAHFASIDRREGLAMGAGLTALGAMGIVVAIVALNVGVVSTTGYTVLVLAAIATSITAPQLLRRVVDGWETPPEEAKRLDREAIHASSEILGSQRILLPTRGGANSRYAARLIAGVFPDAEVTVFVVDVSTRPAIISRPRRGASAAPSDVTAELSEIRHHTTRVIARDPAAAIAREARLGYDLMLIGASADDEERPGSFSTAVDRILALVDIPTIIVHLPSEDLPSEPRPSNVLVPVVASRPSRAAEELAYSLASSANGRAAALHVVNRAEDQGMMFSSVTERESVRTGREITGGAAAFGERLGISVDSWVEVASNAEATIVEAAIAPDFDLLVIGASNRPLTDRPFFGHRVNYILEHAQIPVAIVALRSRVGQDL
jgi:Kef-type K+ transport system membrane component KefB/nucleotide-binding universal stress UspA family protein